MSQHVDKTYARSAEYRSQLEEIESANVCPFCPGHRKWHPNPIENKSGKWGITKIRENYPNARLHFLIMGEDHMEHFLDIKPSDWADIRELIRWACGKYKIIGGGIAMRFGPTTWTGASVSHLHVHLLVPEIDEQSGRAKVVEFPFG